MFVVPKVTLRVKVGVYNLQHHLDTIYICVYTLYLHTLN